MIIYLNIFYKNKINSKCCNITNDEIPVNEFDFIYLNGIIHHASDVSLTLKKLVNSLKVKGYFYLYFYRSGTFDFFLLSIIRDIFSLGKNICMKTYFDSATRLYENRHDRNVFVADLMDNFFATYIQLFTPMDYIDFLDSHGLSIISSSKIDPYGKKIDHSCVYPSTVITLEKSYEKSSQSTLLSQSINQLDKNIYEEKNIIVSLEKFYELKNEVIKKDLSSADIMGLAFDLNELMYDNGGG